MGKPTRRSIRHVVGSTTLAIYGGTAWIACLIGGVLIGVRLHDAPDDGTTMGGSHSPSAAFPEIVLSTLGLFVLAYGLFAWLLNRQDP